MKSYMTELEWGGGGGKEGTTMIQRAGTGGRKEAGYYDSTGRDRKKGKAVTSLRTLFTVTERIRDRTSISWGLHCASRCAK